MARLTKESQFEALSKELGRVDKERREILNKMKQTPEFVAKYLTNALKNFVASKSWFSNANAKGEQAFYKLVDYSFPSSSVATTKHGSNLITVELVWEHYPYNSLVREKKTETLVVSVFNDIDKQVLNGRKPAVIDEKKILKAQLTEKKAKLKEELKSLELELKSI